MPTTPPPYRAGAVEERGEMKIMGKRTGIKERLSSRENQKRTQCRATTMRNAEYPYKEQKGEKPMLVLCPGTHLPQVVSSVTVVIVGAPRVLESQDGAHHRLLFNVNATTDEHPPHCLDSRCSSYRAECIHVTPLVNGRKIHLLLFP